MSPKLGLALGGLGALAAVSLAVGAGELLAPGGGLDLLLASRLPRTLAALLTGSGLAIAGLVMQTLTRNRFVDPMTSGAGQSAALGILAVTLLAPGAAIALKSLVACAFAFAGMALFLGLVRRLPPTEPLLVPLFGLVYGGVIGAIATGIAWDQDLLQFLSIWMNGEFSAVMQGRYELLFAIGGLAGLAYLVADRLTILSLGHDTAVGLGLDYRAMLQIGLVVVALVSGITVVTVGAIPFVGLVVPFLVVRRNGEDVRRALPLVAAGGAALVLASDIAARLMRYPYEVPVGTVLGVVGAFAFLCVLFLRTRAHVA